MSDSIKIFYMNGLPKTLKSKVTNQTVFRSHVYALAEWQDPPHSPTKLYSIDDAASLLKTSDKPEQPIVYTAYGHRLNTPAMPPIGFNGELLDTAMDSYLLGVGYHRLYSPTLMRFTCPDTFSPFGDGGLNPYAYCSNDPINKIDPSGHVNVWKGIKNLFGRKQRLNAKVETYNEQLKPRLNAIDKLDPPDYRTLESSEHYYLASRKMAKELKKIPPPPSASREIMNYRNKHGPFTEETVGRYVYLEDKLNYHIDAQKLYAREGELYRLWKKADVAWQKFERARLDEEAAASLHANVESIRKETGRYPWQQPRQRPRNDGF
ncbi:RHS repeat-associated core domain-containing protein [Pseudomonas putida]|uniref:RHS repeat-associated core domain-containing protein n=1 Tax=Pseudomonas putida TaxID=303 RepID=UPI0018E6A766|nr:RHS repeat-associated core domain-containing protein [Pseudomonas putida]MBI6926182.1 RHS repeat-associated core domain-containing protein [Pseudomonas putida]